MFKPRATVDRRGYYEYLKSAEWKAVKVRFLKSKLAKGCYACFKPFNNSFHFHHRTYNNLGNEYLRDIITLCPDCHHALHDSHKKSGLSLWKATSGFCKKRRAQLIPNRKQRKQRVKQFLETHWNKLKVAKAP